MNTEEKILNKSLEMFNQRGIEYVGLREIAGVLDMRVSNITYYFPTKDDLVNRLSLELNQLNSAVVILNKDLTILGFMSMLEQVFYNHVQYRCLLLSFVHLMERNEIIADRYKKTQRNRNAALRANLDTLTQAGYLKFKDPAAADLLVSALALLIRFWVSEAAVSMQHLQPEDQIRHYLKLITHLMMPYATAKAKKEFKAFLPKSTMDK